MDNEGLREQKKLATRESICEAAMRLTLERGLDAVRVQDIAAAAGVSPRTYNNYFSSKAQAICALSADRVMRVADALRARPVDEPLDEAIANAMLADTSAVRSREMVRLIMCNRELRGEFFKVVVAREAALAQAIAERIGAAGGDLVPQLLAATYSSAARVATHKWLAAADDADYASMLREALKLVSPVARAHERPDLHP